MGVITAPTMLQRAKMAMRITSDAFDAEIGDLIAAAKSDLAVTAGVDKENVSDIDPLIIRAVCTYCRLHFGTPDDYDRLKAAYDEQKAQLQMASGYGREADA